MIEAGFHFDLEKNDCNATIERPDIAITTVDDPPDDSQDEQSMLSSYRGSVIAEKYATLPRRVQYPSQEHEKRFSIPPKRGSRLRRWLMRMRTPSIPRRSPLMGCRRILFELPKAFHGDIRGKYSCINRPARPVSRSAFLNRRGSSHISQLDGCLSLQARKLRQPCPRYLHTRTSLAPSLSPSAAG